MKSAETLSTNLYKDFNNNFSEMKTFTSTQVGNVYNTGTLFNID